jgi:hypothetical protein
LNLHWAVQKLFLAHPFGTIAQLRYANSPSGPAPEHTCPVRPETHVFKCLLCVISFAFACAYLALGV